MSPENESISNENKTVFSSLFWQLRKIQKTTTDEFILFGKNIIDSNQLRKNQTVGKYLNKPDNTSKKKKNGYIQDNYTNTNDYYENIIACMPNNVYWMDRNCIYLGCNDNVAKTLGMPSRKEVVGKTYDDFTKIGLFTKKQNESFKRDDLKVMSTGKPILNVEEPPVKLLGKKEIYYLTSRIPLFNNSKNIIGVIGISVDITARKKAEKELQESIVRETSQKEKIKIMESLGSSIAHELRTPLRAINSHINGIIKYLPSLINAYELAQKANLEVDGIQPRIFNILQKSSRAILQETSSSNAIIDMLLMNINAMKMVHFESKICSIISCVNEAIKRYPFADGEKELIRWKQKNDFEFRGNGLLIVHVLFNLLKNALFYIAKARKGHIVIWTKKDKDTNELNFTDTGCGIAKENVANVFDLFFSKTHGGNGIGLNFCKMVMQGIDGDILCESKEGAFTKFTLKFKTL